MTARRGPPLSVAPKPRAAKVGFANVMVVLGSVASVGFIAASATLNFRMGYRSADTALDGWVYGVAAALGEGLKATTPFAGHWAWRNREYLAVTAACFLFAALTAYSFSASLGFSAQHRSSKEATSTRNLERHADLRAELDRLGQRLNGLGPQRTPAEVRLAIATLMKKPAGDGRYTVTEISEHCTLNRSATRAACTEVAKLDEELARAEEAKSLEERHDALTQRQQDEKGVMSVTPDPQIDAISYLACLFHILEKPKDAAEEENQRKQVGFILSLVMAIFMELGSGLGLYLSTSPWRTRQRPRSAEEQGAVLGLPLSRRRTYDVDDLESFVLECVEPHPHAWVTTHDIYDEYRTWCRANNKSAVGKSLFERLFAAVARTGGISRERRRGVPAYVDVRLARKPLAVYFSVEG